MASTLTLLTDHLGSNKPKVMGIEYCVDAVLDITNYSVAGHPVTAASLGLSTITQAMICGYESVAYVPKISTTATGSYDTASAFTVLVLEPSDADADAMATGGEDIANVGMIRLRVWGTL